MLKNNTKVLSKHLRLRSMVCLQTSDSGTWEGTHLCNWIFALLPGCLRGYGNSKILPENKYSLFRHPLSAENIKSCGCWTSIQKHPFFKLYFNWPHHRAVCQTCLEVSAQRMKNSIFFQLLDSLRNCHSTPDKVKPAQPREGDHQMGFYWKALSRKKKTHRRVGALDHRQSFSQLSSEGTEGSLPTMTQPLLAEEKGWIIQSRGLWVQLHCSSLLATPLVKYWF